ncbi:MAG: amidohydrolase family protein, partial [Bacillota bacterium]
MKNADIITLDPKNKRWKWVAIKDGKVAAVGDEEQTPSAVNEWDLEGKTVLPGFCDSHTHGTLTGDALCAVDLGEATCINDILDLLQQENKENPSKEIIIGANYLEEKLKEKR